MDETLLYYEEQRFSRFWLWALMAVSLVALVPVVMVALPDMALGYLIRGRADSSDALWLSGIVTLVAIASVAGLLAYARLVVEVIPGAIQFRFRPFHLRPRMISIADIVRHEARTYRPIVEYGGWGIRGLGVNRAYNVRGNRGVQLELRDGRRILFGSQRADELDAAIAAASR